MTCDENNPDLALLVALIAEAVSNHYAAKVARSRERVRRLKARRRRLAGINRRLRECLTRDKRLEYKAWVKRCRRLGVYISTEERCGVLTELVNRKAA